ncbi:MAG: protein kinase domain-containing protein [Burkholderiales bacterium]
MNSTPEILLVEDDPGHLAQIRQQVESENFSVRTATDGLQGLAAVMAHPPDLIISDLSMPKMDGYGLLNAVRDGERTRDIPFVLLAPSSDQNLPQQARALGVDAVLVKPVTRDQLLHTLNHLLGSKLKAVGSQTMAGLKLQTGSLMPITEGEPEIDPHTLPMHFGQFLEGSPTTMMTIVDEDLDNADNIVAQAISKRTAAATVLFSDIRDFTSISERLRSDQVVQMLNAYFARACEPIQRQHGWVVKFLGDGLVALFESPEGQVQDHAERAIKAGLLMILAATRFRTWIAEHIPGVDLPEFSIGVGIHSGEVTICKMGGNESLDTTIIGDTVNIAARLEEKTKELGWSLVASRASFESGGARILYGQRSAVPVKGRSQEIEIVEIIGLQPKISSGDAERKFYEAVGLAVDINARSLRGKLQSTSPKAATEIEPGNLVANYRLIRKLGEGGMSLVYLAQRVADKAEVVLKMMRLKPDSIDDGDMLQRFIQEYALISQIHHPNISRIFEQGFTNTHAYIALEYFPGGDLRSLIKTRLQPDTAQAIIVQVAGALSAIHARGIVHRDLKPDNIMLRNDGSLAIADFGIAKHPAFAMTQTRHGEVFGTPYYLSPEQALGQVVDSRSDLYSLGIMFYEMLTGRKPYYGDNVQSLLYQHVHGRAPRLPQELSRYQAFLDKIMAKRPQDRYQTAEQLIDAVVLL